MEKDLFPVLKDYLIHLGFEVKAEVGNIDIVGIMDDLIIAVEMKEKLNTRLMYQGLNRNHMTDYVYLAIPKPTPRVLKSKMFYEKKTIIRRLELGLLLVDVEKNTVDVMLDPLHYHFKQNKKKRRKLLKEFSLRQTSMNVGGVTKTKIITAYRELALMICLSLKEGPQSTKVIREYTKRPKTTSVLQKNFYGWFSRVERGIYELTDLGKQALIDYENVLTEIKKD